MAECFTSVSEDELCEKCIIKQLLNSVFAWYHELSKPRVCVIRLSLRFRQITQTSVLIIHDIILNLIQKLFIITTFSNTEKRVKIWHCRLFLMNFEVFDISRQVKPKLRKKWRYKIVNLCQLISEIPTPSCLWFLLLKLDQLWMSLRNTCAFTTRNVDINQSEWILSFAHVTRFSNFSAKPQLCVHLFSESL